MRSPDSSPDPSAQGTHVPRSPHASSPQPLVSSLIPVFGLPGNPVSSLVCFELFVRAAIEKLSGRESPLLARLQRGTLTDDFQHRGDRPTYFPASVQRDENACTVQPVRWRGSADLRGFTAANALAIFPAGDRAWQAGEIVNVMML